MAKFKVGEKVIYHRKSTEITKLSPTVEAVVEKVSTGYKGIKYEEPRYHICWPPTGKAVVRGSRLTRPEA